MFLSEPALILCVIGNARRRLSTQPFQDPDKFGADRQRIRYVSDCRSDVFEKEGMRRAADKVRLLGRLIGCDGDRSVG